MNARFSLLAIVCVALPACAAMSQDKLPAEQKVTPEQAAAAREALIAWYECIECSDGELDKVVKYGALTEGALIWTLENGIAPARRPEIERQLRQAYAIGKASMTLEEYVKYYMNNADVTYRSRAATALARLNTPRAKESLESAVNSKEQRPEVRQAIESALRGKRGP
jgi:hypothetical protein